MGIYKLRQRVDDHIGPASIGVIAREEGIVDHQFRAVRMSDFGQHGEVSDPERRVGQRLRIDDLRTVRACCGDGVPVLDIHKGC